MLAVEAEVAGVERPVRVVLVVVAQAGKTHPQYYLSLALQTPEAVEAALVAQLRQGAGRQAAPAS